MRDSRTLQEAVLVADIASWNLFTIDADGAVNDALEEMESRGLDRAPITEAPIHRAVTLIDLRQGASTVKTCAVPITAEEIVSGESALGPLLTRFKQREFFYLLGEKGVEGIVTRADLQRLPVSMAVLGAIILLERALTSLISAYSHGSWAEKLQIKRRKEVGNRFDDLRTNEIEIEEIECLDLSDRFDLVLKISPLREDLGISLSKCRNLKTKTLRIRDQLAHGGGLLQASTDLNSSLTTLDEVQNLLERAQELVEDSSFRTNGCGIALEESHGLSADGVRWFVPLGLNRDGRG